MNTSWILGGLAAVIFIVAIAVSGETPPAMPASNFDYHNREKADQAAWLIDYGRVIEHGLKPAFAENGLDLKLASYTTSIRAVNFELHTQNGSAVKTATHKSAEYQNEIRELETEFQRKVCNNESMKTHLIADSKFVFKFVANAQSSQRIEFSKVACEKLAESESKKLRLLW